MALSGTTHLQSADERSLSTISSEETTVFTETDSTGPDDQSWHDDGDSAVDDLQSNSTYSLNSSAYDFPVEYGRRYHAVRPGVYPMPNDEREIERLTLLHEALMSLLDNRLFIAPIDGDKLGRVLDMGTGTGTWAIQFAERYPNAEVLGNDLSPIQPCWVPPNVKFVVDDLESPWSYKNPFDFIFGRYLVTAIGDWPTLVRSVFDNLKPGGWVEFEDFDLGVYCDDEDIRAGVRIFEWVKLILGAAESIGKDPRPGPKLESWVKQAGFLNVTHRQFKLPIGGWSEETAMREAGLLYLEQTIEGLEAFSMRLMCDVLQWDVAEVRSLLAKVRSELLEGNMRLYMNLHIVYAQKPEAR